MPQLAIRCPGCFASTSFRREPNRTYNYSRHRTVSVCALNRPLRLDRSSRGLTHPPLVRKTVVRHRLRRRLTPPWVQHRSTCFGCVHDATWRLRPTPRSSRRASSLRPSHPSILRKTAHRSTSWWPGARRPGARRRTGSSPSRLQSDVLDVGAIFAAAMPIVVVG